MIVGNKNSGINHPPQWQARALFYSLLLVPVALYVSRAALSVSTILFCLAAMLHPQLKAQLKRAAVVPMLVGLMLLFVVPALSGLWSADLAKWADVLRIKAPLLFLPLAFAGSWQLTNKQWRWLAFLFIATTAGGCLWSVSQYLPNMAAIHAGYLQAKTISVPLQNDHVRFSWLVSLAALLCVAMAGAHQKPRLWLLFAALFFVAYLHLLSARTGLLSVYLCAAVGGGWLLYKSEQKALSVGLIAAVVVLPVAAYFSLPTFNARVRYLLYDAGLVKQGVYVQGSNDGARSMSVKAGWQVVRQQPFGVGAGDVMQEAGKWYAVHAPGAVATDRFYPSSEWLLYGCFAGWAGIFLFTTIVIAPPFMKVRRYTFYWVLFNLTAAFSFAFDMGLEVQYGVAIYAFCFLCAWKFLTAAHE